MKWWLAQKIMQKWAQNLGLPPVGVVLPSISETRNTQQSGYFTFKEYPFCAEACNLQSRSYVLPKATLSWCLSLRFSSQVGLEAPWENDRDFWATAISRPLRTSITEACQEWRYQWTHSGHSSFRRYELIFCVFHARFFLGKGNAKTQWRFDGSH